MLVSGTDQHVVFWCIKHISYVYSENEWNFVNARVLWLMILVFAVSII